MTRRAADPAGAAGPTAGGGWVPPRRLDLRVADADRRAVVDLLGEHFAVGRLDAAEHQERVERAMTARTGADLVALLTDLPGTGASPAPPAVPACRRRWPLVALVVVLAWWSTAWVVGTYRAHWALLLVLAAVVVLVRRRRGLRSPP